MFRIIFIEIMFSLGMVIYFTLPFKVNNEFFGLKPLRMIKHKYTVELMKNVIVSLPPPKGRFQLTTSFFKEISKLIKIDYVLNKGYVWEWQNVIERTNKKIAEYDSCHLKMKDEEEVVEIRKILELPYITMVSTLNDLLLAIDDNRMSESEDSVTDQSYD
jgi:hypothetical protein